MEIKININAPGLETAINNLAQAISQTGTAGTTVTIDADKLTQGVATEDTLKGFVNTEPEEAPVKESKDPASTPPEEAETQAKEAPAITLETVRVKLAELAQAGKQAQAKALISSYGVKRLSDVPQDKYADLLEKASEL